MCCSHLRVEQNCSAMNTSNLHEERSRDQVIWQKLPSLYSGRQGFVFSSCSWGWVFPWHWYRNLRLSARQHACPCYAGLPFLTPTLEEARVAYEGAEEVQPPSSCACLGLSRRGGTWFDGSTGSGALICMTLIILMETSLNLRMGFHY